MKVPLFTLESNWKQDPHAGKRSGHCRGITQALEMRRTRSTKAAGHRARQESSVHGHTSYTATSFSLCLCPHARSSRLSTHRQAKAAGQACGVQLPGPSRASPAGIAAGVIAKITHSTTQTIRRLWLKGNLFRAKQSISSASSPSSFLTQVRALHGEPAGTCSKSLQPSAHVEISGISVKAECTRAARGVCSCLFEKQSFPPPRWKKSRSLC